MKIKNLRKIKKESQYIIIKPIIKVKGNIQDLKIEENVEPKQSNFLLTIKSNQHLKEDDLHLKKIKIIYNCIHTLLKSID